MPVWLLRLSHNSDRLAKWFVTITMLLVVFFPLLAVIYGGLLYWWATSRGCEISARGPTPCIIDGIDYTEQVSGLVGLGLGSVMALGWAIGSGAFILLFRWVALSLTRR